MNNQAALRRGGDQTTSNAAPALSVISDEAIEMQARRTYDGLSGPPPMGGWDSLKEVYREGFRKQAAEHLAELAPVFEAQVLSGLKPDLDRLTWAADVGCHSLLPASRVEGEVRESIAKVNRLVSTPSVKGAMTRAAVRAEMLDEVEALVMKLELEEDDRLEIAGWLRRELEASS